MIDPFCPSLVSYNVRIASSTSAKAALAVMTVLIGLPAFILFLKYTRKVRLTTCDSYEPFHNADRDDARVTPPGGMSVSTITDTRSQLQRYIDDLDAPANHYAASSVPDNREPSAAEAVSSNGAQGPLDDDEFASTTSGPVSELMLHIDADDEDLLNQIRSNVQVFRLQDHRQELFST